MAKQGKTKKFIIQFTEYMIGGGAWFWVGYGAFAFMDKVLHIPFWPTKISSYIIGASVNFLLQRFWVFKQKNHTKKQLGDSAKRYYSLMFVNFVLDQAIVGGLRAVGITPYIGQFISSGFFTVWNWLWYSMWVFKKSKPSPRKQHAPALHHRKNLSFYR
ncbi:GtrA family protein [Candidatus Saccharibacteria bacterium]|nr:GtrA family protein [Candidatus Saccharibacteria bacterium]